jgi:hypothetical protein
MHPLRRANDRVDGAGLETQAATDALILEDHRHSFALQFTMRRVEWLDGYPKQCCERANPFVAAWWTTIDIRVSPRDCFRIRPAPGKPATATLCLRQQSINPGDQWFAGGPTTRCRIGNYSADSGQKHGDQ